MSQLPTSGAISFYDLMDEFYGYGYRSSAYTMSVMYYKATGGGTSTSYRNLDEFHSLSRPIGWSSGRSYLGIYAGDYQTTADPIGTYTTLFSSPSSYTDDGYWTLYLNGMNFYVAGTGYAYAYPSSNGYITFGSGYSVYSALGATNPPVPTIHYGPADRNVTYVGYKVHGPGYNAVPWAVTFRMEGNYPYTGGAGRGNGNIVQEVTLIPYPNAASNGGQMIHVKNGRYDSGLNVYTNGVTNGTSAYLTSWTGYAFYDYIIYSDRYGSNGTWGVLYYYYPYLIR